MLLPKAKPQVCVVCGKLIDPRERRFVDKNRMTKVEHHTHLACRKPEAAARESS